MPDFHDWGARSHARSYLGTASARYPSLIERTHSALKLVRSMHTDIPFPRPCRTHLCTSRRLPRSSWLHLRNCGKCCCNWVANVDYEKRQKRNEMRSRQVTWAYAPFPMQSIHTESRQFVSFPMAPHELHHLLSSRPGCRCSWRMTCAGVA